MATKKRITKRKDRLFINTMAKTKTILRGAPVGYRLALSLVREMDGAERGGCFHIEEELNGGMPQRNIVGEYLARVRSMGDVEAEAGFSAMLTEFIASEVYGCFPCDVQKYYGNVVRQKAHSDNARADRKFQSFVQSALMASPDTDGVRHG